MAEVDKETSIEILEAEQPKEASNNESAAPETPVAAPEEGAEQAPNESQEGSESEESTQEDDTDKSLDELPLPGEENEDKKKKLPKWAEKRLSRKEREIEAKAQEAAALRAELERLKTTQPAPAQQGVVPQTYYPNAPVPSREAFENDADWVLAVTEYGNAKKQFEQGIQQFERTQYENRARLAKEWENVIDKGNEKYDDFEEKVQALNSPGFPTNIGMGEAILESPYREDILYFLATYKDKAKEIALLSPALAGKRIAEIEGRFKAKTPAKDSKAPPIIKPLTGGKTSNAEKQYNKNDVVKIADSGSLADFENFMKGLSKKKNRW